MCDFHVMYCSSSSFVHVKVQFRPQSGILCHVFWPFYPLLARFWAWILTPGICHLGHSAHFCVRKVHTSLFLAQFATRFWATFARGTISSGFSKAPTRSSSLGYAGVLAKLPLAEHDHPFSRRGSAEHHFSGHFLGMLAHVVSDPRDNRLVGPRSSHLRTGSAPRCRLGAPDLGHRLGRGWLFAKQSST